MGGPSWFHHVWLPWSELAKLPLLKEILPDQIAPFLTLFIAFLLALGLDALYTQHRRATSWLAGHRAAVTATATAVVAVAALVPVFATFDVPLTVRPVTVPSYIRTVARTLPEGTVLLTVPFAVSGSAQPMLWQAVDHMQFDLAGAALKTPGPTGGPVEPRRPRLGAACPDEPERRGRARAERDAGAARRRAARAPHVGGGPGGGGGHEPEPALRHRLLHDGARRGADRRGGSGGVDPAARRRPGDPRRRRVAAALLAGCGSRAPASRTAAIVQCVLSGAGRA